MADTFIPSTISAEAQAFLREAILPEGRQLSPESIGEMRASYSANCMPASLELQDLLLESAEDTEIGGVRVQVCTPKDYDTAKEDRAVLYFYGGGYVAGGPAEDLAITARLADLLGCKIFAPYYRLAPEHPFPAALDDAIAFYRMLLESVTPEKLVVTGESAGGNLAIASTLRAKAESLPLPAALAVMSPWADLSDSSESMRAHRGLDPTFPLSSEDMGEGAAYGGGRDLTDPLISPAYNTDWTDFPPTLITSGTRDLLMSDCARLSTVMRQAGVDVSLNLWEGMWHVFEWYPQIPESGQSLEEIAAFLEEHFAC